MVAERHMDPNNAQVAELLDLAESEPGDGPIVVRSSDAGPTDWAKVRPSAPPPISELWHMINQDGALSRVLSSRCWEWQGARNSNGYGVIRMRSEDGAVDSLLYMHRHVYTQIIGPIPRGLELDHLCRNRICCNPRHLQPVTHRTNMSRANKANAAARRQAKRDAIQENLRRLRAAQRGKPSS